MAFTGIFRSLPCSCCRDRRVLGACVIEKHFTLDKNLPGTDHQASLEPDELAAMVAAVRMTDLSLGDGKKNIIPAEQAIKSIARKSLVARVDIPANAIITPELIDVKRRARESHRGTLTE